METAEELIRLAGRSLELAYNNLGKNDEDSERHTKISQAASELARAVTATETLAELKVLNETLRSIADSMKSEF